jgi:negative regulator of flagellin synthesis FlgM
MVIKSVVGEVNPYAKRGIQENDKAGQAAKTAQAAQAQKTSETPSPTDMVSLSDEAKLRAVALQTASAAPEVRSEKVKEIKEQVKNGTYKPDIKKAAANLIREDLDLLI